MSEARISKDKVFEEVGYKPHAAQTLYHNSDARFKVPCCGRRFGKSFMVGHNMTAAMFIPDMYYWIIGPTYATGEKEFRVIHADIFRKMKLGGMKGMRHSYNVEQGNMSIHMPWNTILEVKSAQKPDSLIGEGLNGAIMAEAAVHGKDTWEMYIEPALLDNRGWCDFPSTPRGHNWYEGMWLMGQDPQFDSVESWRFPTWANSAKFPLGLADPVIQEIKRNRTEFHWQQEYCAEFTAIEGKIYEEFKREVHVIDVNFNPFWKNFQVFDYGFNEPFVCLDIMLDGSDNVYVWREYQVKRKTNTEHALILNGRENPENFHVDGRFGDPRNPDATRTLNALLNGPPIIGRVLPVDLGVSEKLQGYDKVKEWMKIHSDGKPKFFIDRSCTETIRQLEQLQAPVEREGKNTREGQREWDDHGPDCVRYFFAEYFILGWARGDLMAVYGSRPTEADKFFQYHSQIRREEIPYGFGS